MNLQEVQELRDLNVELLQDNIKLLHTIDEYCAHFKIPIAFDADLQERVKKALSMIAQINGRVGSPPELDTQFRHHDNWTV